MILKSIPEFEKYIKKKEWNDTNKILSYSKINTKKPNLIEIYNIRNFTYYKNNTHKINYYNKTFDINKIKKVYR